MNVETTKPSITELIKKINCPTIQGFHWTKPTFDWTLSVAHPLFHALVNKSELVLMREIQNYFRGRKKKNSLPGINPYVATKFYCTCNPIFVLSNQNSDLVGHK